MKISGKYELQVISDNTVIQTIELTNTITAGFLEYLSQILSGSVSTIPKYVGFGLGIGTDAESAFFTSLENEQLRVAIDTYNTSGTGVLTTETIVPSITLQNAGITTVTELGIFCVNDTDNEATVSSTVDTGTLVSRVVINVNIASGDTFLIKRTDTITGG